MCDPSLLATTLRAMLSADLTGVPVWNWLLQGVGLCTAYAGAELNARQQPEGFALWIVSNAALSTLHALTGLWLLFVLDMLFFRVNVMGLRRWRKTRRQLYLIAPASNAHPHEEA